LAARAQQQQLAQKLPRIGFLQSFSNENVEAFVQGLRESGYVCNIAVELRLYGAAPERLPEVSTELLALPCDAIFAAGPYPIEALAKRTNEVPIVGIDFESDPVAAGWARSLSRPGGNVTGLFLDLPELGGKQIELLKEVVPNLSPLAILWDSSIGTVQFDAANAAARVAGVTVLSLPIRRIEDFKDVFARAAAEQTRGMVVLSSPLIGGQRALIANLARETRLPSISLFNLFPRSGGLMAYGPDQAAMYGRAALYVDRILKGAKPGELPIERPSRFELIVNLKTAKALGITVPPTLLARADEVIE